MKLFGLLLISVLLISGCKTSKDGCSATRFSGERYKTTKFKW